MISKQETPRGHTYLQWLIALTANTSLITYGLQVGWVSPMTAILQSAESPTEYALTDSAVSWVGSTMALAACFGVPLYSYIADTFGRKKAVLALSFPQALCWLLKLSSANTLTIITARVFSGLGAGGCFAAVPMYVKEISQDNIRGLLGCLLILSQNTGVLIMYLLGAYLGYFRTLYCVIWLPFFSFAAMLKAPESPAYLMKIGKVDEATSVIAFLRGLEKNDELVLKEIENMKNEDLHFKALPNVTFFSIFKNKVWRYSFFIVIGLMTAHASNGSFTIVTYASSILTSSGQVSPELQTLSFPILMILAALVSMSCIERFGRKPVLYVCFALIAIAMACIATVVLLQHRGVTVPSWIPLVSMIVAVAGYAAGPSPVPFIILSEIFNFQIRAKLIGFIVSYTWFINFIQLFIFSPISNALGLYTAFYFYAIVNIASALFSWTILPETKGKSVEEIESDVKLRFRLKE